MITNIKLLFIIGFW